MLLLTEETNMLKMAYPVLRVFQKHLLTKLTFVLLQINRTKILLVLKHFWEISVQAFQHH